MILREVPVISVRLFAEYYIVHMTRKIVREEEEKKYWNE